MASFAYKGYQRDGRQVSGTIGADSISGARQALIQSGLLIYDVREARPAPVFGTKTEKVTFTDEEWADLCDELATLTAAHLTTDQCLRLIADETSKLKIGELAAGCLADVLAGESLSKAMSNRASNAELVVSLLRAGERSGEFSDPMQAAASHYKTQVGFRRQLSSALTYPLIVITAALFTVVLILFSLVPALIPLFEDAGVEPPVALSLIQRIAHSVNTYWAPLSLVVLLLTMAARVTWNHKIFAQAREAVISRFPFWGALRQYAREMMFCRSVGLLLRAGVPLVEAVQTTSQMLASSRVKSALLGVAQQVTEGSSFHEALEESGLFSRRVLRFVAIGEETNRLDQMLLRCATVQEQAMSRAIERLMTLLGPSLTIFIGVLVGSIILTVMQAILSVNELVLR